MHGRLALALALLAAAAPIPLDAATSSTFLVNATVQAGCLVVGGVTNYGNLAFGSYSALSTAAVTTQLGGTTVTLQCTPGVTLSMKIGGGQNNNGVRNLKRSTGSNLVAYQLYSDAAFSQVLGIDQTVTVSYADPTAIKLPVYARAQLTGALPAGSYSDVLQVTLTF
ncbi:spore coat protein U domain-containing protein [Pseudomonas putida CSV86]|uniref:Spore coat protein U domain-containing protein n=1 Tax=Pseudomonas bharatica CSV86 TaxID=1005395 RepID=L1LTW3_9PSED|nr:spore coat U domain-containing protein [Pseudomonas bharatica]NNJ15308.1 spore coat protein U domain-containing protein [Pseudomonas bharatica CSV86]